MKRTINLLVLVVMLVISQLLLADGMEPEALKKDEVKIVTLSVENGILQAHYMIPEDMHQTLQEDYFYLDVEHGDGVVFEETVYPEGHVDEDGYINFEKEVTLIKSFKLLDNAKPEDVEITVYAGYQYCYETYCEPPVEVEFEINLTEGKK